ncbi:MAG: hypothetical protein COB53_08305 [Elusimicrobia bacterium]|nr:MAG: hypothetical protein COB53_08305 [Elusimicrobiota bacterium]
MRKTASILLSTALVVLAPGLAPYEVLAGVAVRSAGTVRSGGINGKYSAGASAGLSQNGVEAITVGTVVSNLVTVGPGITLSAPVSNAADLVVSPSLSVPKRTAKTLSAVVSHPKKVAKAAQNSRGPPTAAVPANGNKNNGNVSGQEATPAFSLASAASLQSVRFDGAAFRSPNRIDRGLVAPQSAPWVGRPNLLRANPADSASKTDIEILFAEEFINVARERSMLSGKDRWAKNEWARLKRDVQNFVNGAGSSAVATKRGNALQAGIFKFKWSNKGIRIFARLDPTGTQLTILDLKLKEDLLGDGEAVFYEELAERVVSGEVEAYQVSALPKKGRHEFRKLKLPDTAISGKFKKAKTAYGWRIDERDAESRRQLKEVRNGADAALGFDPNTEIGSDAEAAGVFEPQLDGTLDASKLKVPLSLRAKRSAWLGLHYASVAGFATFLALAVGWMPMLIGFGAAGSMSLAHRVSGNFNASSVFVPAGTTERDLLEVQKGLVALQNGKSLSEEEMAKLNERVAPLHAFMNWAEGAAQVLVLRAGLDGYRAPRLWFNETLNDPYAAHSSLGDFDRASSVYIGVGYLLRPMGETLSMMAHEMGHLFFGDYGMVREKFRLNKDGKGFRSGMTFATRITFVAAAAATAIYAAQSVLQGALIGVDPVSAAASIGWIAAAFMTIVGGLMAGFAATRQDEMRADHFSAWLTHPRWWISWLRMRRATREQVYENSPDERSSLQRLWDRLMSTHPDYDTRIAALEAFKAPETGRDIPALPMSDSLYGLNGETTLVLSGLNADALEAFQANLEGPFEVQVYFVENQGETTGATLVRVHRTDRVQLDNKVDREVVAAIRAAAQKANPKAKVISATSKPHDVFRWAAKSATARAALRSLKKSGVPIRWDKTLGPEDARGIFRAEGENGPEILVNPSILLKASPKALLALISHEAYHAGVWAKMNEIGIDWLNLGGLEFERLAHTIGLRVFSELKASAIDDIVDSQGEPVFGNAVTQWTALDEDAHIDYLKKHGYDSFVRLRDIRALAPKDLAAELGREESPTATARKVEALWKFYLSESRAERRWHFWSFLR